MKVKLSIEEQLRNHLTETERELAEEFDDASDYKCVTVNQLLVEIAVLRMKLLRATMVGDAETKLSQANERIRALELIIKEGS